MKFAVLALLGLVSVSAQAPEVWFDQDDDAEIAGDDWGNPTQEEGAFNLAQQDLS